MKFISYVLCVLAMGLSLASAQQPTNAPRSPASSVVTNKPVAKPSANAPATTSVETNKDLVPIDATTEDLWKMIAKPPTNKLDYPIIPSSIDPTPTPELSTTAKKHEYAGFRLGMSFEEASLLTQTAAKKLDELVKDSKYQMEGALTDVPRRDKVKTLLYFRKAKVEIIMLLWDLDHKHFGDLQQILTENYGKALKADELFCRYWVLDNGDCVRLMFAVGDGQTSIVYGSKQAVTDLNDEERRELKRGSWPRL